MGSLSKMLVQTGSPSTAFTDSSERYALLAENLTANRIVQGRNRITGDLSQHAGNVRQHSYFVNGSVVLQPGPADLDNWLPRIMGLAGSSGTYNLGSTFEDFSIFFRKENADFRIDKCRVNYAVLQSRSAEGEQAEELVTLTLNIMGVAEIPNAPGWPDPEPDISFAANQAPYAHWEGALAVNSINYPYRRFALAINNNFRPMFYNGLTPSCFRSAGRRITVQTSGAFTSTTLGGSVALLTTGASGSLALTNGLMSTTLTMPHLRNSYRSPSIRGKDEIPLELELEAFATTTNNDLVVVNDSNAGA